MKIPRGIFVCAHDIWRHEYPDEFYGYSYKSMDPRSYAIHQLGLIDTTAVSGQILHSHGKAKSRPAGF